jgi:hypothetical protein
MSLDKIGSKLDEYLRIFESGSLKDEVKKMTVENLPDYINEITRASNSGKLVFFIGAGLSKLSGYPTWNELVAKYDFKLHGENKDFYSSDELLRIPQMFFDLEGEEAYDRIIEETFNVNVFSSSVHYMILALNPVHIITTNYDDLIEKTYLQRGKYYSHISVEDEVAKASSTRYLLKVHGDFKDGYQGKYIVLKENDYLNYEINYPLISTLMKTIMATNTLIFIGYSLGDYNIKLLLNWVKHYQKDSNKPFFIYTDSTPIDKSTFAYYEKKGLRLIDSNQIITSKPDEYPKRYTAVMQKLIESSNTAGLTSEDDIVDYVYQKVEPLFILKFIRKMDLKFVFNLEYYFEVNGRVHKSRNMAKDYLEQFFKINKNGGHSLSIESSQKFDSISKFFKRINIFGMDTTEFKGSRYEFSIDSLAYNLDYSGMEAAIQSSSALVEENYEKAFYLAYLGRWEEAYKLYSEIIFQSIDKKEWWIYYLSQINRFNLYQTIVRFDRTYGLITLSKLGFKDSYSSDFVKQIEIEMGNLDINEIFRSMPNDFQEKYKLLEFLSDNQFLYQDTVRLFELTGKIHKEIFKGSYTFGALTSDLEVQLRLDDTLRFIYENCLWPVDSHIVKEYARNSLIIQFEREHYELTREIDEIGKMLGADKNNYCVRYYDFVNITKYFTEEELNLLEKNCKLQKFNFLDTEKIENYICRLIDILVEKYPAGVNYYFNNRFIQEAKTTFHFAKYIKLTEETIIKMFDAILFHFPLSEADIGKKTLWCDQLCGNNGLPEKAILIIEKFLIRMAKNYENDQYSELTSNGINSWYFSNLIHHFHEDYVSSTLSCLAIELSNEMISKVSYFYKLYPILSDKARQHLSTIKEISSIHDVLEKKSTGDIQSLSEYEPMIYEYLEQQLKTIETNRHKKIIVGSQNYVGEIAALYFIGEIKSERFLSLLGMDDEYDFFVDPLHFDYTKFKVVWLRMYSHNLLIKISNNEKMKQNIVPMLKNKILSSSNNQYTEILIKYFI